MMDRGNLIKLIPKKVQIPKFSSWEVTQAEFVNKEKNQVRSRQKRMSNVAESGEEHSILWGVFMAATMNVATIQNFIMNSEDLTVKQMFDISEKLVSEQDEINNLDKISWKNRSWKRLSLIGDETVINLQSTKVYVFSDSVFVPRKDPSTSRIQRSLEEQSYRNPIREKLQRL